MRRGLGRATVCLFVIAASIWMCGEAAARFGLARMSKIQHRILEEARDAQSLRRTANGPKTILFTGNSLFLEGVDFPRLASDVAPAFSAHRFVVESTLWYDWYYGLRRLFRRGMRADWVVVSMTPLHLTAPGIRGNFSAHYLFDLQDIWPVSRDIRADATVTSGLYLAHESAFFGTLTEMRTALLGKVDPRLFDFWQGLTVHTAVVPSDHQLIANMVPRLAKLRELCASYGVICAVLIPPTRQGGDAAAVRAGEMAGVAVLRPIANFSLGPELYRDGFHLNAAGAKLFTNAIEREMDRLH